MRLSIELQRLEFVKLAETAEVSFSQLCVRFGISRKSGYKWMKRARESTEAGALADRSRRPRHHPRRTSPEQEAKVLELRRQHPRWGGRKLRQRLRHLGQIEVPAVSTCTQILRRHGVERGAPQAHRPFERFEWAHPNELWQMDFKGHFATLEGTRCHPLTILDDHSRYSIALRACDNERTDTVRGALQEAFERYGMPAQILCDNGPRGAIAMFPTPLWGFGSCD